MKRVWQDWRRCVEILPSSWHGVARWNKPCGAGERARIEAWARLNGLEVAARL